MFPLIETIIAFSAIMLALSFLVKSLTSVIENHFDSYSRNLKHEVFSLIEGTIDISRKKLQKRLETEPKKSCIIPQHGQPVFELPLPGEREWGPLTA